MSDKRSFTCDCGQETLMIWNFDEWEGEPQHAWVDVHTARGRISLKWKLKTCWAVLTGRDYYLDGFMFSKNTMAELGAWLTSLVEEKNEPIKLAEISDEI